MAKMDFKDIAAFSKWCVLNKKDSKDPESLKAYKASLVPATGGTGHRGRIKDATVRIFAYDGEGNCLTQIDCLDKQDARMLAGAAILGDHENAARLAFTRGFGGKNPNVVRIVTPDGQLVEGYPISVMTDMATGDSEAVNVETDEDLGDENAHAAE